MLALQSAYGEVTGASGFLCKPLVIPLDVQNRHMPTIGVAVRDVMGT